MILSPCYGVIEHINEKRGYTTIYMTIKDGDFLYAPVDGLLRVIEKEWETICSIRNQQGNMVIIRENRRKSRGPCSWHPRRIKMGNSMGVPVIPTCIIEIRLATKNLLLTCAKGETVKKLKILGLYTNMNI